MKGEKMSIVNKIKILIILAYTFLFATAAFSNGINPPRPAESQITSAIFLILNKTTPEKIYRVYIKDKTSKSDSLTFITDEMSEEIPLSQIQSISFTVNEPNTEGVVQTELKLLDEENPKSSLLVVTKDSHIYKLVGFRENGNKLSIPLTACKTISFLTISSDDSQIISEEGAEE